MGASCCGFHIFGTSLVQKQAGGGGAAEGGEQAATEQEGPPGAVCQKNGSLCFVGMLMSLQ